MFLAVSVADDNNQPEEPSKSFWVENWLHLFIYLFFFLSLNCDINKTGYEKSLQMSEMSADDVHTESVFIKWGKTSLAAGLSLRFLSSSRQCSGD